MRIHDSGTLDPRTVDLKTQSLGPWAITSLSDCLGLWEMYTKTQIQFEDPCPIVDVIYLIIKNV